MRKILLAITFTVFLIFFFINLGWFWDLLSGFVGIITPFLIGFLIAYILNFPYKFLYTKAFGKSFCKSCACRCHLSSPMWAPLPLSWR